MVRLHGYRRIPVIATAAAAILCVTGCSPRNTTELTASDGYGTVTSGQNDSLVNECEHELRYLDGLIEAGQRSLKMSVAVLAEAVELRRTAADLMLDLQYELALELIAEAITLLKEP